MPSLVTNATGHYVPQIVPNKTRCGNLDPVEMNETNKCYCSSKDKDGAGKDILELLAISNDHRLNQICKMEHILIFAIFFRWRILDLSRNNEYTLERVFA